MVFALVDGKLVGAGPDAAHTFCHRYVDEDGEVGNRTPMVCFRYPLGGDVGVERLVCDGRQQVAIAHHPPPGGAVALDLRGMIETVGGEEQPEHPLGDRFVAG